MCRRIVALALVTWAVQAAPAQADCIDPFAVCVCGSETPEAVVVGFPSAIENGEVTMTIDQVFGTTTLAPGETFVFPATGVEADGLGLFVHVKGGVATHRQNLGFQGLIDCEDFGYTTGVSMAAEMALATDCRTRLQDDGFKPGRCNDTPGGCSSVEGAGLAALVLVAGLFALRRR